ncbi:MAG: hypothetical protein ACKVON_17680, partial [Beijerinckiaceae bacterium]
PKPHFRSVQSFPFRVNVIVVRDVYGAGYKIRTRDPLITNQYKSLFYRTPDFSTLTIFHQKTTYFRGFWNCGVKSAIDAE